MTHFFTLPFANRCEHDGEWPPYEFTDYCGGAYIEQGSCVPGAGCGYGDLYCSRGQDGPWPHHRISVLTTPPKIKPLGALDPLQSAGWRGYI